MTTRASDYVTIDDKLTRLTSGRDVLWRLAAGAVRKAGAPPIEPALVEMAINTTRAIVAGREALLAEGDPGSDEWRAWLLDVELLSLARAGVGAAAPPLREALERALSQLASSFPTHPAPWLFGSLADGAPLADLAPWSAIDTARVDGVAPGELVAAWLSGYLSERVCSELRRAVTIEGELRDAYREAVAGLAASVSSMPTSSEVSLDVSSQLGVPRGLPLVDVPLPHLGGGEAVSFKLFRSDQGLFVTPASLMRGRSESGAFLWGDDVLGQITTKVVETARDEVDDAIDLVDSLARLAQGEATGPDDQRLIGHALSSLEGGPMRRALVEAMRPARAPTADGGYLATLATRARVLAEAIAAERGDDLLRARLKRLDRQLVHVTGVLGKLDVDELDHLRAQQPFTATRWWNTIPTPHHATLPLMMHGAGAAAGFSTSVFEELRGTPPGVEAQLLRQGDRLELEVFADEGAIGMASLCGIEATAEPSASGDGARWVASVQVGTDLDEADVVIAPPDEGPVYARLVKLRGARSPHQG